MTTYSVVVGADNPFDGIVFSSWSRPRLVDLDADGDLDALVGLGDGTFDYYENTGTATSAAFTQRIGAGNPMDGVDIGAWASPALVDIDNDGDKDIFIGEGDKVTPNFYENTGTASAPVFTERTGGANPFNGTSTWNHIRPTFFDLDNDGDMDAASPIYVNGISGAFTYYENTGTAGAAVFVERGGGQNPFNNISGVMNDGTDLYPVLADIDGDGDADLSLGYVYDNNVLYYENTGSVSAPVFTRRIGAADPFDSTVSQFGSRPAPEIADINGDGTPELFVGDNTAISFWRVPQKPVLSGLDAATFQENALNNAPALIDTNVTFSDSDSAHFNTGNIIVSYAVGGGVENQLGIRNVGTGGGQIGVSGANVTYGGVTIGTIVLDGVNGANLRVNFNASATPAAVEALIESFTYQNTSDTPTTTRTLSITITDNTGNASTARTSVITVNAEDEPVTPSGLVHTGSPSTRFLPAITENELGAIPAALQALKVFSDAGTETNGNSVVEMISSADATLPEGGGALYLIGSAHYGGGSVSKDYIVGNLAENKLIGFDGNDTIIGLADADVMFGNTEADVLLGGFGNDSMYGGKGGDTLVGNNDADNLSGNLGDDTLFGNAGADTLFGNSGNDSLAGGSGADMLAGGAGADTLLGNLGDDTLYGDAGNDVFVFHMGDGMDTIADFNKGDAIIISGMALTAEQLMSGAVDTAQGVLIQLSEANSLLLLHVARAQLAESDFMFA